MPISEKNVKSAAPFSMEGAVFFSLLFFLSDTNLPPFFHLLPLTLCSKEICPSPLLSFHTNSPLLFLSIQNVLFRQDVPSFVINRTIPLKHTLFGRKQMQKGECLHILPFFCPRCITNFSSLQIPVNIAASCRLYLASFIFYPAHPHLSLIQQSDFPACPCCTAYAAAFSRRMPSNSDHSFFRRTGLPAASKKQCSDIPVQTIVSVPAKRIS